MALIAKDNGGSFELAPVGLVQAVCVFVEDIGTHESSYQGKPILRHQVVVGWELNEKMKLGEHAGKRFLISKFYTLSLNEKAGLRKDLESWRGKAFTEEELKGFDLENLLGVNCMINVITDHKANGNETRTIGSISPLYKGLEKLQSTLESIPEWIQKQREKSIEWKEIGASVTETSSDDDLPF